MRDFNRQHQPELSVAYIDTIQVTRPKNYRYSCRNGRMNYGFVHTLRGSIRYDFLSGPPGCITAPAGSLLFLPRGCAYTATFLEEDTQHRTVQFDLSSGALPSLLSGPELLSVPNPEGLLDPFFRKQNAQRFYRLSCLYRLLWQIDSIRSNLPPRYQRLLPALSALTDHCEANAPVAHYAQLCGMSEVNFRRLFREYTGCSPIEYRNDRRLEEARNLLRSGEYNVSEAAESVGFSNLSFFIRLYREKFGHTPKQT